MVKLSLKQHDIYAKYYSRSENCSVWFRASDSHEQARIVNPSMQQVYQAYLAVNPYRADNTIAIPKLKGSLSSRPTYQENFPVS